MSLDASQLTLGAALLLSLVNFLWFVILLFPRRRGQTPYCRRCRYNLSGTQIEGADARCPECGTHFAKRSAIVRGEKRYRRGLLAVTGTFCLLALGSLGLGIYSLLVDPTWIQRAPTDVLLLLATSKNPLDPDGAFRELNRRLQNDSLSAADLHRLIETCLDEHGLLAAKAATAQLASDMLADLLNGGAFSEAQKNRLIDNLAPIAATSDAMLSGMNACITISYRCRGSKNLVTSAQLQNRRLNGQPCALAPGPSNWKADSCAATGQICQVLLRPADGNLEFSVEVAVRVDPATPIDFDRAPLAAGVRTIRVPVTVRQGDPRGLVRNVDTPELRDHFVRTLRIPDIRTPTTPDEPIELLLTISEPTPVRLVYQVSALVDGQSIPLGLLRVPRGASGTHVHRARVTNSLPPGVTVVVTPDARAALDLVDHPDYYGGSFQFDRVPVNRAAISPQQNDPVPR